MFNELMTDRVTLLKGNGDKYDNICAIVDKNIIFISDTTLSIEEGDKLIRVLPNKLQETYIVVNSEYYEEFQDSEACYEVQVRKEGKINNIDRRANINNFYGSVTNSQIQQNVQHSSQVISVNEEYDKKDELIKYISTLKENVDKVGLQPDEVSELTENIHVIEHELKTGHCKPKVVKECLSTIRNVLEGVAGSLIASGLIYQMGNLIN